MSEPTRGRDTTSVLKPGIVLWWANGQWHARSDDPRQGEVSATDEIVLNVVRGWLGVVDELARWAETYGHPEEWAKKAQQTHARAERAEDLLAEIKVLADSEIAGGPRLDALAVSNTIRRALRRPTDA